MAAIRCKCGRSWRRDLNVFRVVRQGGRGGIAGARLRMAWLVVGVCAVDSFPASTRSVLTRACALDGAPLLASFKTCESTAGSASIFLAAWCLSLWPSFPLTSSFSLVNCSFSQFCGSVCLLQVTSWTSASVSVGASGLQQTLWFLWELWSPELISSPPRLLPALLAPFASEEGVNVDDAVEVVWMAWRTVGISILNACEKKKKRTVTLCYEGKLSSSVKCHFGLHGRLVGQLVECFSFGQGKIKLKFSKMTHFKVGPKKFKDRKSPARVHNRELPSIIERYREDNKFSS